MSKQIPTDKELYKVVKDKILKEYPKNSAYRSGLLVQRYKEEFNKKHKNNNAYIGNKEQSNLKRWFKEEWKNQRGEIGYKKKGDVYRPTKRINDKTPTTFQELTKTQIKNAMKQKKEKGQVKKFLV